MPIHLAKLDRRDFLVAGTAGVVTLATSSPSRAEGAVAADRIAMLSDTHIPNHPDVSARGVNMTDNLRGVVAEILSRPERPSGVLINGDCAYLKGLPDDYSNLSRCVSPLAEAEIPLHLTMGNHDDRGPLYEALREQRPETPLVRSKHVTVVTMPHANLFLLDSLHEVNVVTGELGESQLAWLAEALDGATDKPAVIVAHHNPQFSPPAAGRPWSGIRDTERLFELLGPRQHVQAVVFGHTHHWSTERRGRLHLINLPPVAYVFNESHPNGWVDARLHSGGVDLRLQTIDPDDERNGQLVTLDWS